MAVKKSSDFQSLCSPYYLLLSFFLSVRLFITPHLLCLLLIYACMYVCISINLILLLPISFSHLFNSHHILDCRRLFLYKSRLISAILSSMHASLSSHIHLSIQSTFTKILNHHRYYFFWRIEFSIYFVVQNQFCPPQLLTFGVKNPI